MKRHSTLLFTLGAAMLATAAAAQTVPQDVALSRAAEFLTSQQRRAGSRGADATPALSLAYRAGTTSDTYYYIFNDDLDGGFVIIGGDEAARQVLGYSPEGSFDYDSAPDNVRWWLGQYEQQISHAIGELRAATSPADQPRQAARRAPAADKPAIGPLLQIDGQPIQWNQLYPYNSQLPGNFGTGDYALATGCVATAAAQIMRYHRHPEHGVGSKSYTQTWTGGNIGTVTFSADFAATTYDWQHMLPTYQYGLYTSEQAEAVGTLMYHVGVAANMNYGQIISGGSGANSENLAKGLIDYFDYDRSTSVEYRAYYTDEDWEALIYNELSQGRPILYRGGTLSGSGHAFVCEGYRSGGMYYFNWGWGGSCNGYYPLQGTAEGHQAFTPTETGIGGASAGDSYDQGQDAVIGIRPNQGGGYPLLIYTNTGNSRQTCLLQNNEATDQATIDLSSTTEQPTLAYQYYPWNRSSETKTFESTVMLRDVVTGDCHYAANTFSHTLDPNYLTQRSITIEANDFQLNGTYQVYPVVREAGTTGEWLRVRVPNTLTVPTITIVGGGAQTLSDVTFAISDVTVEERRTLQITHDEHYTGQVTYSVSDPAIVSVSADGIVTGLHAGSATITVRGTADTYYRETTTTFQVTVTPYVERPVQFAISADNVLIGRTVSIDCLSTGYSGAITYSTSDASVATVSSEGKVTGVAIGTARITVSAAGDDDYVATTVTFDVTVIDMPFNLIGSDYHNGGYYVYDGVSITASIRNDSGSAYRSYTLYTELLNASGSGWRLYTDVGTWPMGATINLTLDFSKHTDIVEAFRTSIGSTWSITFCDIDVNPIANPLPLIPCNELTISHTLSADGWSTLCLPFEANVPQGVTAYSISEADGNRLIKTEADRLQMNVPYLLSGTPGTYTFTGPDTPQGDHWTSGLLVGVTQADCYAPQDSYVLQMIEGRLGFYRVQSAGTQRLRQHSAYLQLPEAASLAKAYYFTDEEEAIDLLPAQPADAQLPVYSIHGQRTDAQARGLVISNGKINFVK